MNLLKLKSNRRLFVIVIIFGFHISALRAKSENSQNILKEKAKDRISQMTLEDKMALVEPPHFKNRLVTFSKEKEVSREEIKKYESKADVAVNPLGRSSGENYENVYLSIKEIEKHLLKNVSEIFHATGKKVALVVNIGGVCETASWIDNTDAILLTWLHGQEGGHAVADIISGKLQDSFPMKYEDVPSADSFNVPTAFEFGFGMSYTAFD